MSWRKRSNIILYY